MAEPRECCRFRAPLEAGGDPGSGRKERQQPTRKGWKKWGIGKWWRRRESNPRPQALRSELYMLIPSLFSRRATRRTGKTRSQPGKVLAVRTPGLSSPRSRVADPWDPDARAHPARGHYGWFLGSECVVVVVGNYSFCSWIYEVTCPSACTRSFATSVEAVSPPDR